jgi:hypothetical protein
VLKLRRRVGDAAPMSIVELVDSTAVLAKSRKPKKPAA